MADTGELLAATASRLDLAAALRNSQPNDLLPPRVEDGIMPQLSESWIGSLEERIRSGSYRPLAVEYIFVPKTRFSTRPASLASVEDRVVFDALTTALDEPLQPLLASETYLYWPRGFQSAKRWQDFKRAPLKNSSNSHVVIGDIASFYDSVDHSLLRDSVLQATGWPDLSAAIAAFLSDLMGRRRGIPQGLIGSDVLATLYLSLVDSEMAGRGYEYTRHGDDIRIGVKSYAEALQATHDFELAVRAREIQVNDYKLSVRLRRNYDSDLRDIETTVDSLKLAWIESTTSDAEEAGQHEMADLITRITDDHPEFEETGWEWYRGDLSQDELIELIEPYLEPGDEAIAENLLKETFRLRPGGEADRKQQLSQERFGDRFNFALTTLRAAKSSVGISFCQTVLQDYPEQTENVCQYLESVIEDEPEAVVEACSGALVSDLVVLDWQTAWLLRVLSKTEESSTNDALKKRARGLVRSDSFGWFARVAATTLLARHGRLTVRQFHNLWNSSPQVYRPELILAAANRNNVAGGFDGPLQFSRSDEVLRLIEGAAG